MRRPTNRTSAAQGLFKGWSERKAVAQTRLGSLKKRRLERQRINLALLLRVKS